MTTRLQDAQSRHAMVRAIQTDLEKFVVDYTSQSSRPTLVTKLLFGVAFEAMAEQTGSYSAARASADEILREVYARYKICSRSRILLMRRDS